MTFEDLRRAKAVLFPELSDALRVTWEVIYGDLHHTVALPDVVRIGEVKRMLESSAEFRRTYGGAAILPMCYIAPKVRPVSIVRRMPIPKRLISDKLRQKTKQSTKILRLLEVAVFFCKNSA